MFVNNLQKLINRNEINKSILSKESGIPYSTIDGFFKKGADNTKLSTLIKLSEFFEVSLDYLIYGEDEPNTPTTENSSVVDLSENKEETILDKYNMLDDIDKGKIEERIDTFLEDDKYKKELKQA